MGNLEIEKLLEQLVTEDGSDLHLSPGNPPRIRKYGELKPIDGMSELAAKQTEEMLFKVLTEPRQAELKARKALDFSFGIEGLARFRVNIFLKDNGWSGVFRVIPVEVKSFKDLGLPEVVRELCNKPRGLVLVTGPTGSGKSTTLAAMIDEINNLRHDHILTVEDPIEFVHKSKKCLINQREVGSHVETFADALRSALRQDPDVILIGEMRDQETLEMALRAAETGHLTFGTLHTNSASSTINRIIDAFPANQQGQIRAQLSVTLEGVISQNLIKRADGKGRVMAMEIMIGNDGVRNLVRENKIEQLYSQIQTGYESYKMQTMEMALAKLVVENKLDLATALTKTSRPDALSELIKRGGGALVKHGASNQHNVMMGSL